MTFKKLALAAAVAAAPVAAFSVESLEDTDLGGVTGQDGIQVLIDIGTAGITTDLYIHDKDGLTGYADAYSFDGAVVIDGLSIGAGSGPDITLNIDAGDSVVSGGAPVLNVQVVLPTTLTIQTGDISVANSQIDDTPAGRSFTNQSGVILDSMNIVLGSTTLNIQLGNEQQTGAIVGTDMIRLASSITGGLSLSNFALNDANSGGAIGMSSMTITDAGGTNLTISADINVTTSGLEIGLGQLGSVSGLSIEIVDQYLGTTTAGIIGDISVVGLNLNGSTVIISGK